MKTKIKYKLANCPININPNAWYYEARGHIHMVVWSGTEGKNRNCTSFKLPWKTLIKSAKSCRPEEFKK